ncbi:MAG TPA: hypothetical protein VNK24_05905 [Elusimicrobiota bacterium]|nr:hypothetical protein [Elusimicrobiota bacterium]
MKIGKISALAAAGLLYLGIFNAAMAAFASAINFQGRLTDASRNPITATESIQFSIWNAATSGSELWNETQSVTVSSGIYNVALGSVVALSSSVFAGGQTWLQIQVGSDAAMTPRLQFQAAPYALTSAYAPASFDPDYPDGTSNWTFVSPQISLTNTYTVPAGDDFYFYVSSSPSGADSGYDYAQIPVSGAASATNIENQQDGYSVAGAGMVLASTSSAVAYQLIGYLVPASVTIIAQDLSPGGTYTVPIGKNLYHTVMDGSGGSFYSPAAINGAFTEGYTIRFISSGSIIKNIGSQTFTLVGVLH